MTADIQVGLQCPSDGELVAFVEHRADPEARDALEQHVAGCASCADLVAAVMPPDEEPVAARVGLPDRESEPSTGRASLRRTALAAGLVLATAAVAYGAIEMVLRRAGEEVARRATEALGQPVTVGRIGLGLGDGLRALRIHAHDVRTAAPGDLAAVDVQVTVPLASLVDREPVVTSIRLVGATLRLASGAADTGGSGRGGGANAVAALAAAAPLEIVEGALTIAMPETSLEVQHLNGMISPSDGRLAVVLSGVIAGGTVTAEGELASDANGTMSLTIGGRDLALAALPGTQGRITGSAELQLRVTGSLDAPTIAGRTLVRNGRFLHWNPLATLLMQPESSGALAALSPNLGGADLGFDDLRAAFTSAAQGGWQFSRLHVATAGIIAGATVRVAPDRTLTGSGTIRVPPPVANALVAGTPAAPVRDADSSLTFPFRVAGTTDRPAAVPTLERAAPPVETPLAPAG
jgi:hypothetical protein